VRHELPGTYYNVRYRELHGLEAIPQWNHWRELPGLGARGGSLARLHAPAPAPAPPLIAVRPSPPREVRDGYVFTLGESRKAYKKMSGNDVAEPSLAASLKDDDRAEGYTPDYS